MKNYSRGELVVSAFAGLLTGTPRVAVPTCVPGARARLPWRGLAVALLLLLGAMASAHAQIGGGHGRRQNNQQQTPQRSPAPTTPVLARDMATVGRGRAHMQVARRSRQISDANRQWFECYNTRTGARLPYYPEADGHPASGSRRSLTHPNRHDGRVQRDLVDQ
jgi:hypothetical protein